MWVLAVLKRDCFNESFLYENVWPPCGLREQGNREVGFNCTCTFSLLPNMTKIFLKNHKDMGHNFVKCKKKLTRKAVNIF